MEPNRYASVAGYLTTGYFHPEEGSGLLHRTVNYYGYMQNQVTQHSIYGVVTPKQTPCRDPDRTLGLQVAETPKISRQTAYEGGKVFSPTQETFMVLICVSTAGKVTMNNPVTP